MDATLLTTNEFWDDPALACHGAIPDLPELRGHVLFETSGSSGTPKWVALSKRALLASATAVNQHLAVDRSSRWGLALPLHHVGGFGVAARSFQARAAMAVFPGKWNAIDFHVWLVAESITHTSLVPTQYTIWSMQICRPPPSSKPSLLGAENSNLRSANRPATSAGPSSSSYGMTEAGSQIATQVLASLRDPYKVAPISLLPIWAARTTADSRLEISGPALFSGYVIDGEFHPRPSDWHLTADRVALENRLLTPLGRADAVVKVLGELVDPAAIEHELLHICSQIDGRFAIVATPDTRAGHILVPVFEDSSPRDLVERALATYNASAPGFRRLHPPIFVPRLPRSELGKIRRGELLEILRSLDPA